MIQDVVTQDLENGDQLLSQLLDALIAVLLDHRADGVEGLLPIQSLPHRFRISWVAFMALIMRLPDNRGWPGGMVPW